MKLLHFIIIPGFCFGFWNCNLNKDMPLKKVADKLQGTWINKKVLESYSLNQTDKQNNSSVPFLIINKEILSGKSKVLIHFQNGDYWLLKRDEQGLYISNIYNQKIIIILKFFQTKKIRLGHELFVLYDFDINKTDRFY